MSKKSIQHINDKDKDKDLNLPKLFSALKIKKPNIHLLHLSILRQLNNKRAGTASTKTRSEVRGGGRKPWKQKGTGRARAGSIRSPLWRGGGIAFGPKPRDYSSKIPQKARNLAIAQAIKLKENDLVLIKKLPDIKDFKTKALVSELKTLGLIKHPVLLICSSSEPNYSQVKKSSRNLPSTYVKEESNIGVFDLLKANSIAITEQAMSLLEKRFSMVLKSSKQEVA